MGTNFNGIRNGCLGKMAAFMTERLVRGGHRVVGFDRDPAAFQRVVDKGAARPASFIP